MPFGNQGQRVAQERQPIRQVKSFGENIHRIPGQLFPEPIACIIPTSFLSFAQINHSEQLWNF